MNILFACEPRICDVTGIKRHLIEKTNPGHRLRFRLETMNTNFLSLLITAASAALVIPLSAQSGPQDLGVEPSLIEQQMQRDMRKVQAFDKLRDFTLTRGKADDDEEWDMVRRLERDRQDQSVDAIVQRMMRNPKPGNEANPNPRSR